MRSILCLLLIALTMLPKEASALSCYFSHGEELINQYSVIFQASPLKSSNDPEQVFQIKKVYKGDVAEKQVVIKNQATQISKARQYDVAKTYVFFFKDKSNYQAGPCSPEFSLETINAYPDNYWAQIETLANLEFNNSKSLDEQLGSVNVLQSKMPDLFLLDIKKGELLEKEKRYEEAENVYKSAIRKKYQRFVKEKWGDKPPGGDLGRYANLTEGPLEIPPNAIIHKFAGAGDAVVGYVRMLNKLGKIEDVKKLYPLMKENFWTEEMQKIYLRDTNQIKK